MQKNLVYVGCFNGVSKSNNPFTLAYFYGEPDEKIKDKVFGFANFQFFIDKELYPVVTSLKPLQKVSADVRFIGGQNVLISLVGN